MRRRQEAGPGKGFAMNGSGTIQVLKRDGSVERFDRARLAGGMWRAMSGTVGRYRDARQLAEAVELYLERCRMRCVSSAAVFEMALQVLRRVGLEDAAAAMEAYRAARRVLRTRLRIRHESGTATLWDRTWLSELAERYWGLRPRAARTLAGQFEGELLAEGPRELSRAEILRRLNRCAAAWGLADAVPVTPPGRRVARPRCTAGPLNVAPDPSAAAT